jgi:hypothetical protein
MEQTAEQVTPANFGRLIVADEGRSGSWVRRLKAKRPVRTMGVVVLNVDRSTCSRWLRPRISSQSRHSARTVRIQRSA